MVSSDGINWEHCALPKDALRLYSVCWSSELSIFVAVGESGNIVTSTDGNN